MNTTIDWEGRMKIIIEKSAQALGEKAACICKDFIDSAIEEKGYARMVFSTGASQFTTFEALLHQNIDWSKVEMFHLDEYVDLPETHRASFRKYLKERFINKVQMKKVCLVGMLENQTDEIARLTRELHSAPIDVGLIGIGENAHIAFNDPPADFESNEAYKVVKLSDTCKAQQVREGWFDTRDEVPSQAISMTVNEILRIQKIVCAVPYKVKAEAIKQTLTSPVNTWIPATKLKEHNNVTLILDEDSSSLLTSEIIQNYQ